MIRAHTTNFAHQLPLGFVFCSGYQKKYNELKNTGHFAAHIFAVFVAREHDFFFFVEELYFSCSWISFHIHMFLYSFAGFFLPTQQQHNV